MLTDAEHNSLMLLLELVTEAKDFPAENTAMRLLQRSGLPEETVAWGIDVLCLEGKGWLDFHEHPRTLERAYYLNDRYRAGREDLDDLHARWGRFRAKVENMPKFDADDEDPDDYWAPGVYED